MALTSRKLTSGSQEFAGSVTFNAPGNWTSPNRLVQVTADGRGGTGNPGNPGTAGNGGARGNGNPGNLAGGGSLVPGTGGFVTISWNTQ
jgi:hypothetical protein